MAAAQGHLRIGHMHVIGQPNVDGIAVAREQRLRIRVDMRDLPLCREALCLFAALRPCKHAVYRNLRHLAQRQERILHDLSRAKHG